MEQCDIRQPKQWIVTVRITCGAGESLESACWRWRPIMADRLSIQASGDERVVLRLLADAWQMAGDTEAVAREVMERYRLSIADGDRVEVVETLQSVGHDGSL